MDVQTNVRSFNTLRPLPTATNADGAVLGPCSSSLATRLPRPNVELIGLGLTELVLGLLSGPPDNLCILLEDVDKFSEQDFLDFALLSLSQRARRDGVDP